MNVVLPILAMVFFGVLYAGAYIWMRRPKFGESEKPARKNDSRSMTALSNPMDEYRNSGPSPHNVRDPAASDVARVSRRKVPYRQAIVMTIVTAGISLSLAGCSSIITSAACSRSTGHLMKLPGLTLSQGTSSTTLPPSHDNDAGKARITDVTPDNDTDANQRSHSCPK